MLYFFSSHLHEIYFRQAHGVVAPVPLVSEEQTSRSRDEEYGRCGELLGKSELSSLPALQLSIARASADRVECIAPLYMAFEVLNSLAYKDQVEFDGALRSLLIEFVESFCKSVRNVASMSAARTRFRQT